METQLDQKPLAMQTPWRIASPLQQIWRSIIRPHASLQHKNQQRQARLLATMLFIVIVIGGTALAFVGFTAPEVTDDLDYQLFVLGTGVLGIAYALSRTRRYQVGAGIFIVLLFSAFVFVPFSEGSTEELLSFAVLAVLVTGLFFPQRWVSAVGVVEVGLIIIQAELTNRGGNLNYLILIIFIILADAMIVTFIHHLSSIERERRAELEYANDQLRQSEARLEQRVRERTRDLTVASDVSRRTTTVLDSETLLPQLTTLTRQGFDLYGVAIYLHDEKSGVLRCAAEASALEHKRPGGTSNLINLSDAKGLIPYAARMREVRVINDTQQEELYRIDPVLPDTRSEMVLPMLVGDHLVGVLDLQSDQLNRFSEEDRYILTTLAEQMAIAIRNAELFKEAQEARQAAETANETKSRFLANMSHELRTPLNAILNFTAFVADGVLGDVNEEQVEVLNESIASGKHLLSLINDVLDITKIEAGMMELFIEKVDINTILSSVVSVGKGLVKEKPIKLEASIEDDLPSTFGDKRRLRQVFLNIVSNAAKFTAEGEIEITAKRWQTGIEVTVRDTGLGIATGEHHKVFESFKQARHDLTGAVGTGLGMPITKYFVEMHGGDIWFESAPDVGTTFTVRLPHLTLEQAERINDLMQPEAA